MIITRGPSINYRRVHVKILKCHSHSAGLVDFYSTSNIVFIHGSHKWVEIAMRSWTNTYAQEIITSYKILSKSHVKRVWVPQNLPRSWGRFCRFPNSLRLGFTFPMDAKTSKYIRLQLFYGNEANFNKTLRKSKKGLVRIAF